MNQFAFVLGNGESRAAIDPEDLLSRGTVYACNRAYQDFEPHVLVSVDKAMAREIQASGYSSSHVHYTRSGNIISGSGALPITHNSGYSSGPVALSIASSAGHPHLMMLGMDLHSGSDAINNIYKDTLHYKAGDAAPTHWGNWVSQIESVIAEFPTQRFIHVNPLAGFTPQEWLNRSNFEVLSLEEFRNVINIQ